MSASGTSSRCAPAPVAGASARAGAVDRADADAAPPIDYRLRHTVSVHDRAVSTLKFSPDGRVIASGSSDRKIAFSGAHSGRVLSNCEGHLQGVTDVAWSCDGGLLASGSDDATVRLWDVAACKEACAPLRGHASYVFCVDVSPRGTLVASGSFDESVRLWDVRSGRCIRVMPAHSEPITSCQFIADGTVLLTSSYDGLVRLWDVATGACLKTVQQEGVPPIGGARFSPNCEYVLTSSLDARVRLVDYHGSRCLKTFTGHVSRKLCAAAGFIADSPDMPAAVFCGGDDGYVTVWTVNDMKLQQRWRPHGGDAATAVGVVPGPLLAVDASPTTGMLVTGGSDSDPTVRIWVDEGAGFPDDYDDEGADDGEGEGGSDAGAAAGSSAGDADSDAVGRGTALIAEVAAPPAAPAAAVVVQDGGIASVAAPAADDVLMAGPAAVAAGVGGTAGPAPASIA